MPIEKYLSVKEVSEILSIPQGTIRDYILKRKWPVCKIGRLVRIKESFVRSQLKERPAINLDRIG